MTSTGYNNRHRASEEAGDQNQAGYKAEAKTTHAAGYDSLGEDEKTGYQASNQHTARFLDELKGTNEKSASAFENWRDRINDYELRERRETVNSYADAMNSVEWNNREERKEAALEVAHNTFRPIYEKLDTETALGQYNISKKLEEYLLKNKVQHIERLTLANGEEVLQFKVKNKKEAKKLIEESGGELYKVPGTFSGKKIEKFEGDFSEALMKSDRDPGKYKEEMNDILEKAMDHWRGIDQNSGILRHNVSYKNPQQENTQEETGEEIAMIARVEHQNDNARAIYEDLKGLDEEARSDAVKELVHERMKHVLDAQEEFRSEPDNMDARGAMHSIATHQMVHTMKTIEAERIGEIIEKGTTLDLEKALETNASNHEEIAHSIRENNGSILMKDYNPPSGLEDHRNLIEDQIYLDSVKDLMAARDSEMPEFQREMITRMSENYEMKLRDIEETEQNPSTNGVSKQDYNYLSQTAAGMQYLLRPHDDEFWKLHDRPNPAITVNEQMDHAIQPILEECPQKNLAEAEHLRDLMKEHYRSGLVQVLRGGNPEEYRKRADEVQEAMTEMLKKESEQGGVIENPDPRLETSLDFQPSGRADTAKTEAEAQKLSEYISDVRDALGDLTLMANQDHAEMIQNKMERFQNNFEVFSNFAPDGLTDRNGNDIRHDLLEQLEIGARHIHTLTAPMR